MNVLSLRHELETLFDAFSVEQQFSGVALIAREGEPLLHKAYGKANYEHNIDNHLDTKFCIASITKPITAMAILMLVEKGILDLHHSCLAYLPDGQILDKQITVHHLLTHSSGIPDFETMPGFADLGRKAYSYTELLELLSPFSPDFAPGQGWKYCNTGYNLLGWIIEHISGMTYDQYIEKHILLPLGMTNTHCGYNQQITKNLAAGYSWDDQNNSMIRAPYFELNNFRASGNLCSTAMDLLKWDRAIYTQQLVSADTQRLIFTPHTVVNPDRHYGYGWYIYQDSRGHGGWLPGYWSKYMQYPDQQMTIILLGNHDFTLDRSILERTKNIWSSLQETYKSPIDI
ncbi:serine hydrolase domain-containing protein [Paenibacillus sp. KN14-4R]|uniref:serine hydrolase domain-containing protein n=1 Tax=Paenibacillus sp. KN14-4R TaxID=3445773 RepID=UPI003F9F7526